MDLVTPTLKWLQNQAAAKLPVASVLLFVQVVSRNSVLNLQLNETVK